VPGNNIDFDQHISKDGRVSLRSILIVLSIDPTLSAETPVDGKFKAMNTCIQSSRLQTGSKRSDVYATTIDETNIESIV
jgi:hypothetical protein